MPYIKDTSTRYAIDDGVADHLNPYIITEGDLNYTITRLVDSYASRNGKLSYASINTVIGVLSCVLQEYYRRVAAPYENSKCQENGDVYHGY